MGGYPSMSPELLLLKSGMVGYPSMSPDLLSLKSGMGDIQA